MSGRSLQIDCSQQLFFHGPDLQFNSDDHRGQVFVQLLQHDQLLQRQVEEPVDQREEKKLNVTTTFHPTERKTKNFGFKMSPLIRNREDYEDQGHSGLLTVCSIIHQQTLKKTTVNFSALLR